MRLDVGDAVLPLTLALPEGPAVGGVVGLHPSGDPSRDQPLFRHLATTLPTHGIAVLLHDRRPSTAGDVPLDVQARDALAVAEHLRDTVGDVPIGLWGWSQGAWAAALAASMDDRTAFLIVVASVGVTPAEQMRHGTAEHLRRAGFGQQDTAELLDARALYEAGLRGDADAGDVQSRLDAIATRAWWDLAWLPRRFPGVGCWTDRDFDPRPIFAATSCPVLAVWGDDDPWVPVEASHAAWQWAAGDRLTVVRLPGTDHEPDPRDDRYEQAVLAHVRRATDQR